MVDNVVRMVVLFCGNVELLVTPCVDVDVVGMVDADVVVAFTSNNDDE